MNTKTYVEDAERTQAKFPEGLLLDEHKATQLANVILQAMSVCTQLDALKKNIYYNKPIEPNAIIIDDTFGISEEQIESLKKLDCREVDLLHAALGKLTEASEVMENVFAHVSSPEDLYDPINAIEEVGDGWWYDAILLRDAGISVEQTMHKNITKLRVRYPEKFSKHNAVNRDLEEEQKALEEKPTED